MMYFLVLVILLLGFLGLAQSPVKVFEFHSVTVFVKDELNNPAKGAFVKAFSPEWGVAYPHFEEWGIADGEGEFRFVLPTGDWVFLATNNWNYSLLNPNRGFFIKVFVHIDSNTSLILKPKKAVTLRIYDEKKAPLPVDELYALDPQYIPAVPPAFIGYTKTGVFTLYTTEDQITVIAIKRPSQGSPGYILTGSIKGDGEISSTNSSRLVFTTYEANGSLSQYWNVEFRLPDLYIGNWVFPFSIPGRAEFYVTPMNVVVNPRYIPPGWYYYFEGIGLSLETGHTYSYSFGGKAQFNIWVIKGVEEDTQLHFDVRDQFGNVLAFYSDPTGECKITLRVFEGGREVYRDNVGKYIHGTLFYVLRRVFSDSATFELYADMGPLGGLGEISINGLLYNQSVKYKYIESENFIFHIPVEYFWNISGQAREQVFLYSLEALYKAMSSNLREKLQDKPHKAEVRLATEWAAAAGTNIVAFGLGVARRPVNVHHGWLDVFGWSLGVLYSWTPPLVYDVECRIFCGPLATYLGIEAASSLYGQNVRLWYWGTHPGFFDYLSGDEKIPEGERMLFIFFYLHKVYGPEIHKRFIQLWANNTSLKDRLMKEGFNINETMITLYSYLAGENLAWLFRIAGYRISEERINEGLRLLPVQNPTSTTVKTVTVTATVTTTYTTTIRETVTTVSTLARVETATSVVTTTASTTVTVTETRENNLSWILTAILATALAATALQLRRKTKTITLEPIDDTETRYLYRPTKIHVS